MGVGYAVWITGMGRRREFNSRHHDAYWPNPGKFARRGRAAFRDDIASSVFYGHAFWHSVCRVLHHWYGYQPIIISPNYQLRWRFTVMD